MGSAESGVRVGKPLPVGYPPGPCNPQGIESRPANGDGVHRPLLVKKECLRNSGSYRIGTLRRVVEAPVPHRRHVAQADVNLISDGEGRHQLFPAQTGKFGSRQHRAEIVAGVAGLPLCQVAVVEVQVTDQRAVIESSSIGRRLAPTDQGTAADPTHLLDVFLDYLNGLPIKSANCAGEGIEYPDLQLRYILERQIFERPGHNKFCKLGSKSHNSASFFM